MSDEKKGSKSIVRGEGHVRKWEASVSLPVSKSRKETLTILRASLKTRREENDRARNQISHKGDYLDGGSGSKFTRRKLTGEQERGVSIP